MTTPRDLAIAIVTQDDPFYIPAFFGPFLDAAPGRGISTRLVVITSAFGESTGKLARRMWAFYGPMGFVKRMLAYASTMVMDRVGRRPRRVETMVRARGIPVRHATNVNAPALVDELERLGLDVILSVSAPQVFKKKLLGVPAWGCVNIHAARLPQYRGMMPNFWAFYHGDRSAGVTVHTMDEALDRGKVLQQGDVEIRPADTLHDLMIRSKVEAARIAVEALGRVRDGTIELRDYEGAGSYFSFPTRDHVRELRTRGKRLQ